MKKVFSLALALILVASVFIGMPTKSSAAQIAKTDVPEQDLYMSFTQGSKYETELVVYGFSKNSTRTTVRLANQLFTGVITHKKAPNGKNLATIKFSEIRGDNAPSESKRDLMPCFTMYDNPLSARSYILMGTITIEYTGSTCAMTVIPMNGTTDMQTLTLKSCNGIALSEVTEEMSWYNTVNKIGGRTVNVSVQSEFKGLVEFDKEFLYNVMTTAENTNYVQGFGSYETTAKKYGMNIERFYCVKNLARDEFKAEAKFNTIKFGAGTLASQTMVNAKITNNSNQPMKVELSYNGKIARTATIAPGKTMVLSVVVPTASRYNFSLKLEGVTYYAGGIGYSFALVEP